MHLILTLLKTNSSNYIGVISQLMPNQQYLHDERILDIQGDWIYPLSHFLFLIFISLELGWPISPPILPISLMVIIPSFVRETTFSTIFTPSPWFFTAAHHVEKPWASLEVTQGRHLTNAFTCLLWEKSTSWSRPNEPNEMKKRPKQRENRPLVFQTCLRQHNLAKGRFLNIFPMRSSNGSSGGEERQPSKLHHQLDFL